jgi:hypothetical protein
MALACGLMTASMVAQAQTATVPYRGQLDSNGAPVTGVHSMRFEVFPTDTGGAALEAVDLDVAVVSGVFTALLPLNVATLDTPTPYLQVSVGPQGGPLTTLNGRQRLYPAPAANRGSPSLVFKANGVSTPTLEVGNFTVGPTALIQAPALRHKTLLGDGQGIASSSVSWTSVGTPCANGRPGCHQVNIPFQSYGGTVSITVETSGLRAAAGLGEFFLILDPDAGGVGFNAGVMRQYLNPSNTHVAFPTFTTTLPTQFTTCATFPCNHTLTLVTRSNATFDASGTVRVDSNDYVRVTMTELPHAYAP